MRGNQEAKGRDADSRRSIPACAGEPRTRLPRRSTFQVYPRVCGGTACPPLGGSRGNGLSPRVRGNPPGNAPDRIAARSIPACAGEPLRSATFVYAAAVYPRVCGGTIVVNAVVVAAHGLSPRVRGNRKRTIVEARRVWSIPACAGEPMALRHEDYLDEVYPRVCGGTDPSPPQVTHSAGLSPRVRGNPAMRWRGPMTQRSIPACAGEPLDSTLMRLQT